MSSVDGRTDWQVVKHQVAYLARHLRDLAVCQMPVLPRLCEAGGVWGILICEGVSQYELVISCPADCTVFLPPLGVSKVSWAAS